MAGLGRQSGSRQERVRVALGIRLIVAVAALGGCAGGTVQGRSAWASARRTSSPWSAGRRLIVPPDFELRPPRPGETRPEVGTTGDQARASLPGQSPAPAAPIDGAAQPAASLSTSAGQQALLQEAGGGMTADPEIRQRIAEENQTLAEVEDDLFTRLLDWRQPDRSVRLSMRRPRPSACAPIAPAGSPRRTAIRRPWSNGARARSGPRRRCSDDSGRFAQAVGAGVAVLLTLSAMLRSQRAMPPCSIPRPSRSTMACRWWW